MNVSNFLRAPFVTDRLAVMSHTGQVLGIFHIETTTFEGEINYFQLPEGAVPIVSVLHPAGYEFVAVVYEHQQLANRPWLGFGCFLSANEGHHGTFKITSCAVVLERDVGVTGSVLRGQQVHVSVGSPEPQQPGWSGTVNKQVLNGIPYFEFSWLELWKKRSSQPVAGIQVLSVPPQFRAAVVGTPGNLFDKIRIIRLGDIEAGTYIFNLRTIGVVREEISFTLTVKD